jgi:phenylalanyl-tRNA synthetase beta chain
MGWLEAWTPSLISDEDFSVVAPEGTAVRVTNPLASQESIMRTSMLVGLTDAWASNADRGHGEVALFEMGVVATHPSDTAIQRESAGGVGGASRLRLPVETSVLSAVLGREGDDARVAVASVAALAERWGLAEYEVRSAPGLPGWHPTRMAEIIDCGTGTVFGYVGEVDPEVVAQRSTRVIPGKRLGFLQIDLNVLSNTQKVLRRPLLTPVPSRFPSVIFDLSLLAPKLVSASVIQRALRSSSSLVESATLFDTFSGGALSDDIRSVTFAIRLSSDERTLNEDEVLIARGQLLAAAAAAGAELRL